MQTSQSTQSRLASQWHASGWFGSQLGGTAWLFVSAAVLARESPKSAAVALGCALGVNLLGCALWSQRASLNPYRALQILISAVVVAGAGVTRWLELRGEFALLDPRVTPRSMYFLLATMWLFLLALFALKERGARGRPAE